MERWLGWGRRAGLALLLSIAGAGGVRAAEQPFVVVDTHRLTLTVRSPRDRIIARFDNVAIGSGGVSDLHLRGDDTTPRGRFRVAWIDHHSRFGLFFGLDYPTPAIARRAYLDGRLDRSGLDAIVNAFRRDRLPPQDTALGGEIGIHGLGSGSPLVQQLVNWTDGCIALTNAQVWRLARWVHVGTVVIVR